MVLYSLEDCSVSRVSTPNPICARRQEDGDTWVGSSVRQAARRPIDTRPELHKRRRRNARSLLVRVRTAGAVGLSLLFPRIFGFFFSVFRHRGADRPFHDTLRRTGPTVGSMTGLSHLGLDHRARGRSGRRSRPGPKDCARPRPPIGLVIVATSKRGARQTCAIPGIPFAFRTTQIRNRTSGGRAGDFGADWSKAGPDNPARNA